MKWMITGLFAALFLIVAGLFLAGSRDKQEISSNPEALALCQEGIEDLQAFRLETAASKLARSLELDPSLAEASIARALALGRLRRIDEARLEMARAESLTLEIQDDQRRMLAQLQLAAKTSESRFHSMRDSILARLEEEIPDHLTVLEAQAYQTDLSRDEAAMEAAWKRILEINPNYANSYNMLGYLELYRQHFDKAVEYMQKYAYLAPDMANPHDSLGDVYMAQGLYEEAEAEYARALELNDEFYWTMINIGNTYLARGKLKKGLAIMDTIRTHVAGSGLEARIDANIIVTYHDAGMTEAMEKTMASFIAKFPESTNSSLYRACLLARAGQLDKGQAVMDSTLAAMRAQPSYAKDEDSRKYTDRLGRLFDATVADLSGDHATAVRMWRHVLALNPEYRYPHEMVWDQESLASALLANDQPEEALQVVEPLLKINPRLFRSLLTATEAKLDLGDARQARLYYEQLTAVLSVSDPDFPPRAKARELEKRLIELEGNS